MDDIAVTKYMETVISKFLEAEEEDNKFNMKGKGGFKEKLPGGGKAWGDVDFGFKKQNDEENEFMVGGKGGKRTYWPKEDGFSLSGSGEEKFPGGKISGDFGLDLGKNLEQAQNDITVTKFLDY